MVDQPKGEVPKEVIPEMVVTEFSGRKTLESRTSLVWERRYGVGRTFWTGTNMCKALKKHCIVF